MARASDAATRARYASPMSALKARVRNGHLELEEPASLPEGAEFWLVPAPDADDMTDAERADLEEAIAEGLEDLRTGNTIDGPEFLARLRAAR